MTKKRKRFKGITLLIEFIVLIVVGVFYKITYNESIILGVCIGVMLSYIAMIGTSMEIRKINKFEKEGN